MNLEQNALKSSVLGWGGLCLHVLFGHILVHRRREADHLFEDVDERGGRLEAHAFGDALDGEVAVVVHVYQSFARRLYSVGVDEGVEVFLKRVVDDLGDILAVGPHELGQFVEREVGLAVFRRLLHDGHDLLRDDLLLLLFEVAVLVFSHGFLGRVRPLDLALLLQLRLEKGDELVFSSSSLAFSR